MKCKKCGAKYKYGQASCPGCGKKINYKCRQCKAKLSPADKKCPSCGAPTPLNPKYQKAQVSRSTNSASPVTGAERLTRFYSEYKVLSWVIICLAVYAIAMIIVSAATCGSKKEEELPMNNVSDTVVSDAAVSDTQPSEAETTTTTTAETTATTTTTAAPSAEGMYAGMQLDSPKAGETVAVLETNYGTIKIKLLTESAPKTVENFTTLINRGYYDGIIFHRVIKNFMIQGGDPLGTGTGGESCWGGSFEDEFSEYALNINYSVAMANSGANTNGSQFFINNTGSASPVDWSSVQGQFDYYENYFNSMIPEYGEDYVRQYKNQYYNAFCDPSRMSDAVKALYDSHGGNYALDGAFNSIGRGHTVFGQVFEGQSVVDAIAAVETGANDKPVSDVVITRAYTESYQG